MAISLTRYDVWLKLIIRVFFTILYLTVLTGGAYSWNAVKCGCACDSSNLDDCAPNCATECKKSKCAAKFKERDDAQKELENKKKAIEEVARKEQREADAERMRNARAEAQGEYYARRREEAYRQEGKKVIEQREKENPYRR